MIGTGAAGDSLFDGPDSFDPRQPHQFQPGGMNDEIEEDYCAWCGEHQDEGVHDVR